MMPDLTDVHVKQDVLELANEDRAPLLLIVEPWAESYRIPSGAVVEIVAFASEEGRLDVDDAHGRVVIWGWTGSSVHVLRDGQELEPQVVSSAEATALAGRRTRTAVIQRLGNGRRP